MDVFSENGQIGGGITAIPQQDMNDIFTILVPKNSSCELRNNNSMGKQQRMKINIGDSPITVNIYRE